MNIIGKRYWFFTLSLLIIVPGIVALALGGLQPSIDFTGGTILEIHFTSGVAPLPAEVISALEDVTIAGTGDSLGALQVQTISSGAFGASEDGIVIRLREIDSDTRQELLEKIRTVFGEFTIEMEDSVGASIGVEVAQRAAGAVALAAIAIAFYIWIAFRKLPHAFRYGFAAITALIHDVLLLLGVEAMLGLLLGWEADSLFLTAILTVIGFSVHDTIVVFDRIRENQSKFRSAPFERVVNHSIVQTLDRSINTTLTVIFTLTALVLFGGTTTQHFILILLIGIISGAYSSIFNAAAVLVVWENREWRHWFSFTRHSSRV